MITSVQQAQTNVFLFLTRSAFAGQQRYGAHTWSGDITSSWETLAKQIPTGLNFSLSAIPYWNADIGGFFFPDSQESLLIRIIANYTLAGWSLVLLPL